MNRHFAIACGISLGLAHPVTAGTRFITKVQPTPNQSETWKNGAQLVDNVEANSVVRLVQDSRILPGKPSTFQIYVLNTSASPINFGPENVSIELADGRRIPITTYEEMAGQLRRDIKRRQALAAFGNALSAGSADGSTSGSFNYSGTTNGNYVSGTGTYSGHDPALARQQQQAARAQAEYTGRAIEGRRNTSMGAMAGILQMSTIEPGQVGGGVVAYATTGNFKKLVSKAPLNIIVKIADKEHRFVAAMTPTE